MDFPFIFCSRRSNPCRSCIRTLLWCFLGIIWRDYCPSNLCHPPPPSHKKSEDLQKRRWKNTKKQGHARMKENKNNNQARKISEISSLLLLISFCWKLYPTGKLPLPLVLPIPLGVSFAKIEPVLPDRPHAMFSASILVSFCIKWLDMSLLSIPLHVAEKQRSSEEVDLCFKSKHLFLRQILDSEVFVFVLAVDHQRLRGVTGQVISDVNMVPNPEKILFSCSR